MKGEWKTKSFPQCIESITYTKKIKKQDFLQFGTFPVISQEENLINGYWENKADVFYIKKPVVIFGDHTKKIKYIDFDFVLGADGVKIISPCDFLLPKFLFYFLHNIKLPDLGYARHFKLLKDINVPLPPLPKQQRIIDILDQSFAAIDQAIENTEKNFEQSNELFQNFLHEVFNIQQEGWAQKNLGEICKLNGRIGWRGLTAKEYTNSGPLFLSVHSLNYGDYVNFRDAFHISEYRYLESPEIMLQVGDVLICKDGAGIGKCGIIDELPDRATINSSLLLIRSSKSILPKFLYYCLISPYFQRIVNSRLNGATTPHLYQRDITEFPVFLPPIEIQREILSKLDFLNDKTKELSEKYERKITKFQELKQSILHKAFLGEL